MKNKLPSLLILIIGLALGTTGCAHNEAELVVGMELAYPPFETTDPELTGEVLDIINELRQEGKALKNPGTMVERSTIMPGTPIPSVPYFLWQQYSRLSREYFQSQHPPLSPALPPQPH